MILLLVTSILTNQEAVLRGVNALFYEKFMQLESKDEYRKSFPLYKVQMGWSGREYRMPGSAPKTSG